MDIEVTEEVFLAYSQADRRERYIEDEVEPGRVLSWEKMIEDHLPLDSFGLEPIESAEDACINKEHKKFVSEQVAVLKRIVKELPAKDFDLLWNIYMKEVPQREYARQLGVTEKAIRKHRDRIFKKIKKFL